MCTTGTIKQFVIVRHSPSKVLQTYHDHEAYLSMHGLLASSHDHVTCGRFTKQRNMSAQCKQVT